MPYEEDKEALPEFKGGFHTKGVTPETKARILKAQKDFTSSQVKDLQSVLNKLHRQFKSGSMNLAEYEKKRRDAYKNFNITKEERIKFLGAKFAS